jgi:dihydrofolate reductase
MRKLKLQMQITVDGFVAGPNGELDWMTWNWDDKLKDFVSKFHDPVDTILLGRKMTDGFVDYWSSVLDKPESPEYDFAKKMIDTPKVVFSRTVTESKWINTTIESDLVGGVNKQKAADGKDIIVYGGAGFVSSLIKENLIDDYHLFINPAAIGKGLQIFGEAGQNVGLKLVESTPYECGVIVNHYRRA